MSWKKLDIDDLKLILSQDELDRLSTLSLDETITTNINDTIDMVANVWRGALSAKGYTLDVRESYIPASYHYWVLVHARWAVWTRFPLSNDIALDDARKNEYNKALDLLKNPYIDAEKPAWEYDPSNPENQDEGAIWHGAQSIQVPYPQKFPTETNVYSNLWN